MSWPKTAVRAFVLGALFAACLAVAFRLAAAHGGCPDDRLATAQAPPAR